MFSQRSVHNVDVVVIVVVIAVVGTCTVQTFPNPLESPLNISSMLLYRQWHNVAALCLCDSTNPLKRLSNSTFLGRPIKYTLSDPFAIQSR